MNRFPRAGQDPISHVRLVRRVTEHSTLRLGLTCEDQAPDLHQRLRSHIAGFQLGVTAEGLSSAWLSGGGEVETNRELAHLLGYPEWMTAYGTIPIGYPAVDQDSRYRRPLGQLLHWNGYQAPQYRRHAQVDFYESTLRPFAMYRDQESMDAWPDRDEMLGEWTDAFTGPASNPAQSIESEADFSHPRAISQATKRRRS